MKRSAAVAAVIAVALGAAWLLQDGAPPPDSRPGQELAAGPDMLTGTTARDTEGAASPMARVRIEAPAGETSDKPLFIVRVVDPRDIPQAGAVVHAWHDGSQKADERRTDASGRAAFTDLAFDRKGGSVLVRAPGCMPVLRRVEPRTGELRVEVGGGSLLAGVVLVDGQPAPAGLRLTLTAPTSPQLAWVSKRATTGQRTDPGGHFTFSGLTPGWNVEIEVPRTHWVLPPPGHVIGRHLRVAVPRSGLVVRTTRLPTVVGVVLWGDTGEPVPTAEIHARGEFQDGGRAPPLVEFSDEDGRFAIGFHPGPSADASVWARWADPAQRSPLRRVKLRIGGAGSQQPAVVELDAAQLLAGGELRVLLQRSTPVHFLAVDAHGGAVAGARLAGRGVSGPTGEDGRGFFDDGDRPRFVGAPGYLVVPARPRRPAAGTPADPFVFVLQRTNRLLLRLRTPEGSVPAAREVELRSVGLPFAGKRSRTRLDARSGCAEVLRSRLSGLLLAVGKRRIGPDSCTMEADAAGEILLTSLEPDSPVTLIVNDAVGTELLRRETRTPSVGESRELDLIVVGSPAPLRGRVLDENGAPLGGAEVLLAAAGRTSASTRSDPGGAFVFEAIYTDAPMRLSVQLAGYAAQSRDLARGDRREQVVRLGAGYAVSVRVLDEQGAAVPVPVWLESERDRALYPPPRRTGPGVSEYRGLPSGVVTFCCEFARHRFLLEHDTSRPEAVLRVPRPARVVVVAPPDWPIPENGYLRAHAIPIEATGERRREWFSCVVALHREGMSDEMLLLPGRHRFQLNGREPTAPGPRAEVDLPAGELTRVELR